MNPLLLFVAIASFITAFLTVMWWIGARKRVRELLDERTELNRKLDGVREELSTAKTDSHKRRAEIVELREQVRKQKKRQKRDDKDEAENPKENPELENLRQELKRLNSALEGAEARVQRVSADAETELRNAVESAKKQATQETGQELTSLRDKAGKLEKELAQARRREKKAVEDIIPKDVKIDIESLPEPVVMMLRRYYKRSQNFEKLYIVAQSKLEVTTEKATELTRRYHSVCRELALVVGQPCAEGADGDLQAHRIASDVVEAAEDAAKKKQRRRARPRKSRSEDDQAAASSDNNDSSAPESDDVTTAAEQDDEPAQVEADAEDSQTNDASNAVANQAARETSPADTSIEPPLAAILAEDTDAKVEQELVKEGA